MKVARELMAHTGHQPLTADVGALIDRERAAARREALESVVRGLRGVVTACQRCGGYGVRGYGSTATYHVGIGGQMITQDVCDWCWGSGDEVRKWPDHRVLRERTEGGD